MYNTLKYLNSEKTKEEGLALLWTLLGILVITSTWTFNLSICLAKDVSYLGKQILNYLLVKVKELKQLSKTNNSLEEIKNVFNEIYNKPKQAKQEENYSYENCEYVTPVAVDMSEGELIFDPTGKSTITVVQSLEFNEKKLENKVSNRVPAEVAKDTEDTEDVESAVAAGNNSYFNFKSLNDVHLTTESLEESKPIMITSSSLEDTNANSEIDRNKVKEVEVKSYKDSAAEAGDYYLTLNSLEGAVASLENSNQPRPAAATGTDPYNLEDSNDTKTDSKSLKESNNTKTNSKSLEDSNDTKTDSKSIEESSRSSKEPSEGVDKTKPKEEAAGSSKKTERLNLLRNPPATQSKYNPGNLSLKELENDLKEEKEIDRKVLKRYKEGKDKERHIERAKKKLKPYINKPLIVLEEEEFCKGMEENISGCMYFFGNNAINIAILDNFNVDTPLYTKFLEARDHIRYYGKAAGFMKETINELIKFLEEKLPKEKD